MSTIEVLIPPPQAVRERLAATIREAQLLRSLLRLSIRAAEEQQPQATERAGRISERRAS